MGYAIQYQRDFRLYQTQQAERLWQPRPYSSLANQTLVILGTGSIGSHLAHVAKQFGLRVVGVNRTGIPAKEGHFDATYHISELPAALMRADLLVNTLPNTPATEGLLNQENLRHCHQALLFNVGRGKTLVEQGLPDLIAAGHIRHAFLDVFIKEPLAQDYPFWTIRRSPSHHTSRRSAFQSKWSISSPITTNVGAITCHCVIRLILKKATDA